MNETRLYFVFNFQTSQAADHFDECAREALMGKKSTAHSRARAISFCFFFHFYFNGEKSLEAGIRVEMDLGSLLAHGNFFSARSSSSRERELC